MIVMGGIIGAGIFANPSEVAHHVHTPFLILSVWILGGLFAMCGAFIWAELATRHGEILNFEVTVDFIFFGMAAGALFILRRHQIGSDSVSYRVPGHPFTTMLFVLSCVGIVASAVTAAPRNSATALCIMLAGVPVYCFWSRFRRARA
jgi:amino acid transporter